jgi:opacity protein-like surface antigen
MKKLALIIGLCTLSTAYVFSQDAPTKKTTTTTTTITTEEPATTPPPAPVVVQEPVPPPPAPVVVAEEKPEPRDEVKHGYIGGRLLATAAYFKIHNYDGGTYATDAVVSFGGGGLIGTNFGRNVGMQLEVMYSPLAQKYKDQGLERTLHVTYLNIPLLLVLNTDVTKPVNLNICGGPQLGINTGADIDTYDAGENTEQVHGVFAVKGSDIGLAYGAGLDFNIANSVTLNIGYRGVYGLLDISDRSKTLTTNEYYILDRSHVETHSAYAGVNILF